LTIGTAKFSAIDLRYCVIDQNFLATFDRKEIQSSQVVKDLAGKIVEATIDGQYTTTNSGGSFFGSDLVEIINPDKK